LRRQKPALERAPQTWACRDPGDRDRVNRVRLALPGRAPRSLEVITVGTSNTPTPDWSQSNARNAAMQRP